MQLTTEQLESIDKGEPVELLVEGRECVVVQSSRFAELRRLVEDWEPATMQRQMAEMMAEDWSDPAMKVYDA